MSAQKSASPRRYVKHIHTDFSVARKRANDLALRSAKMQDPNKMYEVKQVPGGFTVGVYTGGIWGHTKPLYVVQDDGEIQRSYSRGDEVISVFTRAYSEMTYEPIVGFKIEKK
jgi:hypothetical protein